MSDPLVITAAITGSVANRSQNSAIPYTAREIADAAVEAWREGAAIIHVHARHDDGTPTQEVEIYESIVSMIRDRNCDAVLNLSTGSAGGHVVDYEQRLAVLALNPEMATLDCGSMNFGDDRVFLNSNAFLRRAAKEMQDRGTIVELEVFDAGMVANAQRLIAASLLPAPGVWQVCLGVRGGAPADLQSLAHMVARLPDGAFWSILGVGRAQLPVNLASIGFSGHVRTGLEDNTIYHSGELATGNAQLIRRIVRFARDFGREVATPAEARQLLHAATTRSSANAVLR